MPLRLSRIPQAPSGLLAFAHNHPRGASFSLEDIVLACQYGFGEIRAVTETFRHSMRGNWPSVAELRKGYDEEFVKAERVAHDRIITGELRIPFYGYEIRHLTWVGAANRLQLLYKREKS